MSQISLIGSSRPTLHLAPCPGNLTMWTIPMGLHALRLLWLGFTRGTQKEIRVYEKAEVGILRRSSLYDSLSGSLTSCPFGPRNSKGSLPLASSSCTILSCTHLCDGLFVNKPSPNYPNSRTQTDTVGEADIKLYPVKCQFRKATTKQEGACASPRVNVNHMPRKDFCHYTVTRFDHVLGTKVQWVIPETN